MRPGCGQPECSEKLEGGHHGFRAASALLLVGGLIVRAASECHGDRGGVVPRGPRQRPRPRAAGGPWGRVSGRRRPSPAGRCVWLDATRRGESRRVHPGIACRCGVGTETAMTERPLTPSLHDIHFTVKASIPCSSGAGGVGSIPANSDAQHLSSFRRWRFKMKLSPFISPSRPAQGNQAVIAHTTSLRAPVPPILSGWGGLIYGIR